MGDQEESDFYVVLSLPAIEGPGMQAAISKSSVRFPHTNRVTIRTVLPPSGKSISILLKEKQGLQTIPGYSLDSSPFCFSRTNFN